jgi:hypothetical protein
VVETVLEKVDDLLVGDVDYGGRACQTSAACTCVGSRLVSTSALPGPCEYLSDP